MKRIALLVVAMTSLAAPVSAPADYWRKCGSQPQAGAGWYAVKAHDIACRRNEDGRVQKVRFSYGA